MDTQIKRRGFFRRSSPVAGVVLAVILAFILFCVLLCLFAVKSSLGLLSRTELKSTVTSMLNDDAFRAKVADTVVLIAPEDTLVAEQVAEVMKDETVAEAVGQLGSDWFAGVLDTEDPEAADPVDSILEVLENPERKDTFEEALQKAMVKLDCSPEDLHDASVTLSQELGFEPPPKGSSDLEVVAAVLDGSREKVKAETAEVVSVMKDAKKAFSGAFSLLSLLSTLLGTAVFLLINLCLALILYGLMILLLRNLWKPCYYLGVPYLLAGLILMCTKLVDAGALVKQFDLPDLAGTILNVALDSAFQTGLIGMVIGVLLIAVAITVTIIMHCIENKKEGTQVCSVPSAEVN